MATTADVVVAAIVVDATSGIVSACVGQPELHFRRRHADVTANEVEMTRGGGEKESDSERQREREKEPRNREGNKRERERKRGRGGKSKGDLNASGRKTPRFEATAGGRTFASTL